MDRRTAVYYRNAKLDNITLEDYLYLIDTGMLYVYFPEATGIQKKDIPHTMYQQSRIDTIGQNGNDGEHYEENPDGVSWPHKYEAGYAEKIEKLYDLPKDNAFVDDYEPSGEYDAVNAPKHYEIDIVTDTGALLQVIDVIDATLSSEEAIDWLNPYEGGQYTGVIERILRAPKKDQLQDLKKAHKQLGWLIQSLEE